MINGKSVSLCMVIYNSSDIAQRAITSVKRVVDEVVIIDQGSDSEHSSKLKELANIYYKTTNKGNADFDRQYCYALATKEYIIALDADEFFTEENLIKLEGLFKYDFHIVWFLFKNLIKESQEQEGFDIQDILGDDPHPRMWKRVIQSERGPIPPIAWPHEAHKFPQIGTESQIFANVFVHHVRLLDNVIKTHLHRRKGINDQARDMEKKFVRAVLAKFPMETKVELNKRFPELKNYLKD